MNVPTVDSCFQKREGHAGASSTISLDDEIHVEIYRNIDDVDVAIWDRALTSCDAFMSHDFVAACQASEIEDAEYWHLVVWRRDVPVGIATIHQMDVNLDLLTVGITRRLVQAVKSAFPAFLRVKLLICGLPLSNGKPCFRVLPDGDPAKIVQAVARVMRQIAEEHSFKILCFKEFPTRSRWMMDTLEACGYFRANSLPTCRLEIKWNSIEEYIHCMRAGYRRQVMQTMKCGQCAGLDIRWHSRSDGQADTFYKLYCQTVQQAVHRLETANREFFEELFVRWEGQVRIVSMETNGACIAAGLLVVADTSATLLFVGMDYENIRKEWQVYQNLLLEIIAESIRLGVETLEFGQTSYPAKMRMGGFPEDSFLYFHHHNPWMHWLLSRNRSMLFPETEIPRRQVFKEDGRG